MLRRLESHLNCIAQWRKHNSYLLCRLPSHVTFSNQNCWNLFTSDVRAVSCFFETEMFNMLSFWISFHIQTSYQIQIKGYRFGNGNSMKSLVLFIYHSISCIHFSSKYFCESFLEISHSNQNSLSAFEKLWWKLLCESFCYSSALAALSSQDDSRKWVVLKLIFVEINQSFKLAINDSTCHLITIFTRQFKVLVYRVENCLSVDKIEANLATNK